jgi:hypothetical protein
MTPLIYGKSPYDKQIRFSCRLALTAEKGFEDCVDFCGDSAFGRLARALLRDSAPHNLFNSLIEQGRSTAGNPAHGPRLDSKCVAFADLPTGE